MTDWFPAVLRAEGYSEPEIERQVRLNRDFAQLREWAEEQARQREQAEQSRKRGKK